ncbi:hypothetical protein D3C85_929140 [compost metagenome]
MTAEGFTSREINKDAYAGTLIGSGVDSAPAIQTIRSAPALQDIVAVSSREDIVAVAALQDVVSSIPGQGVVKPCASEVLDLFVTISKSVKIARRR